MRIPGHLDDKKVIGVEDMVQKIRAAVEARTDDDFVIIVRTDALDVTGMEDTVARCRKYVEAGADVLFVEALRTHEEVERVAHTFGVPMLFNFAERGKSPLIHVGELERLGFKIVIFPGSALMTVGKVVTGVMREIREGGTTERLMGDMFSITEIFEIMGLSDMLAEDARFAGTPT